MNTFSQGCYLGVLGGMGPMAGAAFALRLAALTPATVDQQHIPTLLRNDPRIPDRSSAYMAGGENPLPHMVDGVRFLEQAGAQLIAIPCNTAHLWFDEIHDAVGLPMLHIVDAAIEAAVDAGGASGRIGLLATDATLASGLYVNRAPLHGTVRWLLPTAGEMLDLVMPGVAAVKAGQLQDGEALLSKAAAALARRGAGAIVLGCTEIPVVLRSADAPVPLIDATAVLARRAVAWSLAQRRDRNS